MKKGIMAHYLPVSFEGDKAPCYDEYKNVVIKENPDYTHIFYPSTYGREGVEILTPPDYYFDLNQVNIKKEVL